MNNRRLLIWIITPLVLSLILFYTKVPLQTNVPGNNVTIMISEEDIDKPGFFNSIRKIFSVPFDFKYYDIYGVDKSYLKSDEGDIIGETFWIIEINNQKIEIPSGETKIIYKNLKINEPYPIKLHFNIISEPKKMTRNSPGNLYTGFDTFARPPLWDVFVKTVCF